MVVATVVVVVVVVVEVAVVKGANTGGGIYCATVFSLVCRDASVAVMTVICPIVNPVILLWYQGVVGRVGIGVVCSTLSAAFCMWKSFCDSTGKFLKLSRNWFAAGLNSPTQGLTQSNLCHPRHL